MAEIMFETFNVNGLYIGVQAILALFAQRATAGKTQNTDDLTGTVIDSGDGITHVFPICDGAVIPSAVQDIPLAGSDITEYIKNELKARENLSAGDLNEVAQ